MSDRFFLGFHTISIALLGLLVVTMYLTSQVQTYRVSLVLYLGFSILFLVVLGGNVPSFAILVTIGVLSVVLYEPYPTNVVFCLTLVICMSIGFSLSLGNLVDDRATVFVGAVTSVAVGSVLSVVGSLLGRTRNELAAQQQMNTRLAENVVKLTQANISSLSYAASIEDDSRTNERRRLAREIHDLVGYTVTTNITLMEAVKLMAHTEPGRIPEYVETIRRNSEEALGKIRLVLRDLHSQEDDLDLLGLLTKMKSVYTFSTGVQVIYEYGNAGFAHFESYRDVIYHFVQEALINAFRHGKATSTTVFFWQSPDQIEITVEDDGVGANSLEEDLGIKGMRERAARFHGTVEIPAARIGFKIRLTLPLPVERSELENPRTDSR